MPEKNHPQCLIQDLSLVEAFIIILLSLLFYRADKKKKYWVRALLYTEKHPNKNQHFTYSVRYKEENRVCRRYREVSLGFFYVPFSPV